jgi:DNA-binding NtrC family response regulator
VGLSITVETAEDLARRDAPVIDSSALRSVYARAAEVAANTDEPSLHVLILGETGVGKRTLARWIHARSRRAAGRFVTVTCDAAAHGVEKAMWGNPGTPGPVELASRGTLMLEEVGSLHLETQAKLIRVVENRELYRFTDATARPVDVRIISTSSDFLPQMAELGIFRADLLFRLGAIVLEIPPLRERIEDIEPLVRHFVARMAPAGQVPGLSNEVLTVFRSLLWSRNAAQLRDVVSQALARFTGPEITTEHIDLEALRQDQPPQKRPYEEVRRRPPASREQMLAFCAKHPALRHPSD